MPRLYGLRRRQAALAPTRAALVLAMGLLLGAMLTMLLQTAGTHGGGWPMGGSIAELRHRRQLAAKQNRYALHVRRFNPDHDYPEDVRRWLPMVIEDCQPWMPAESAPCVKQAAGPNSNLVAAQELIYPDFRVRRPGFLTDEYARTWDSLQHLSLDYDLRLRTSGWRRYDSQRGQNLVFANATLGMMPPPDSWGPNHCMAAETPHTQWLKPAADAAADMAMAQAADDRAINGTVVLATTPQALTWAHFAEACTHPPLQAQEFVTPGAKAVTGSAGQGAASDEDWQPTLWRGLGFDFSDVLHAHEVDGKVAGRLVFACRCPNYHPMYDLLVAYAAGTNRTVPLSQRKTVMYFSRTPGTGGEAGNGGRMILNETELLEKIRELLTRRGRGEKLEVFNHEKFPRFRDIVQYFSSEVMAIVGPHGSALLNMHWAAPGALVLEVFAAGQRGNEEYWLIAAGLGHNYWALPVGGPDDGKDANLQVPIHDVLEILDMNLGIEEPLGPGVEPGYWWDFESPGLPRSGMRRGWEAPQGGQQLGDAAVAKAMRQAADAAEQAQAAAAAAKAQAKAAKAAAKQAAAQQAQAAAVASGAGQEDAADASKLQQGGQAAAEV